MPLVTLKREIDIPTLVKWTLGLGAALVMGALAWDQVGDNDAKHDREIAALADRIDELEGGMDVKNGVMHLGQSDAYIKGAMESLEAKRAMRPSMEEDGDEGDQ